MSTCGPSAWRCNDGTPNLPLLVTIQAIRVLLGDGGSGFEDVGQKREGAVFGSAWSPAGPGA